MTPELHEVLVDKLMSELDLPIETVKGAEFYTAVSELIGLSQHKRGETKMATFSFEKEGPLVLTSRSAYLFTMTAVERLSSGSEERSFSIDPGWLPGVKKLLFPTGGPSETADPLKNPVAILLDETEVGFINARYSKVYPAAIIPIIQHVASEETAKWRELLESHRLLDYKGIAFDKKDLLEAIRRAKKNDGAIGIIVSSGRMSVPVVALWASESPIEDLAFPKLPSIWQKLEPKGASTFAFVQTRYLYSAVYHTSSPLIELRLDPKAFEREESSPLLITKPERNDFMHVIAPLVPSRNARQNLEAISKYLEQR